MRIALISDLHVDINEKYPVTELTAEAAEGLSADMLIVAGDISETPERTLSEMKKLAGLLDFPVYYVPGNHDMWNKNCPGRTADEIFADYLADPLCLSGKGLFTEEIRIIGDTGWYDYSFAAPEYTRGELDGMCRDGRTWQDKLFNDWTRDNQKAMERALARLSEQLARTEQEENPEDLPPVLMVTHMLPVKEFCVPAGQGYWGFFNAFLGSERLGEFCRERGVRFSVCGHVHYRSECEKDGVRYLCPCLGYDTEWPLYGLEQNGARDHVRDAMALLEV